MNISLVNRRSTDRNASVLAALLLATLCQFGLNPLPCQASDAALKAARMAERELIYSDLMYFSADAMEGRDTGSEQLTEAAQFLHHRLEEYGYTFPESEPDGFQEFVIPGKPALGENNKLIVSGAVENTWAVNEQFRTCSFGGSGEVNAPVVFCGYGIDDQENGFDEFAEIELKGKIALIMRRVPQQKKFGSPYVSKNGVMDAQRAGLRTKAQNAIDRGAVAILFVNDPTSAANDKDVLFPFGYGGTATFPELPIMQIKVETADILLKAGMGKTLAELETAIDEALKPHSAELKNVTVQMQTDIDLTELHAANVIGVLEPTVGNSNETIVLGAHYDHVGWGTTGSLAPGTNAIHNGADDNASGSIALLLLAKRLASLDIERKRRIVLIWFAAEEKGLLGSKHYVKKPIYPLDQTIAMLNLDMVGRMSDEKVTVFGVGSSDVWNGWLDPLEKKTELNFFREKKAFGPSDHASFYEKQVPVLHLFTGLHEDYHRPTDDLDEINIQGIQRIDDVLEGLVLELLRTPERPQYIEIKEWIRVGQHAGGRPNLGLIPYLESPDSPLLIQQVVDGSPAERAGLKPEDSIIEFNNQPVTNREQFWKQVDQSQPGETYPVKVLRDGEPVELSIKLGKPR